MRSQPVENPSFGSDHGEIIKAEIAAKEASVEAHKIKVANHQRSLDNAQKNLNVCEYFLSFTELSYTSNHSFPACVTLCQCMDFADICTLVIDGGKNVGAC